MVLNEATKRSARRWHKVLIISVGNHHCLGSRNVVFWNRGSMKFARSALQNAREVKFRVHGLL